MNIRLNSSSPGDTRKIGQQTGVCLRGHELILLHGDLGSGKTEFTKGLFQPLGIDPEEVVSPTFTLENRYPGKFNLYHLDLYRLNGRELNHLPEIDDFLNEGIIAVEWAQFLDPSYSKLNNCINIFLDYAGATSRLIRIQTTLDYLRYTADEKARIL